MMYYFRYDWDETRGDAFDHWGTATYFTEADSDGNALRQIEHYRSGITLAYNLHHHTDIYGALTDKPVSGDDTSLISITRSDFEHTWQAHAHHNADARIVDASYDDLQKPAYTLIGRRCDSFAALVEEINRVVFKGDLWNGNLDALNDMLHGDFGTPEEGFRLEWQDAQIAASSLGYPETIVRLHQRLTTCHPENRAYVLQQIADAHQQKGTTVFDWIVEIIVSHHNISLLLH